MGKSKIFIILLVGFCLGVFVASLFYPDPRWAMFVAAFSVSILAVFWHRLPLAAKLGLGIGLFACAGVLRFFMTEASSEYLSFMDTNQKFEGYIVEEPDVRAERQLLTFQPKNHSQKILITASKANYYAYGDWAVLEGKLKAPENFSDFDYRGYLERFEVFAVMQYPKILVLKSGQGNVFKEEVLEIKQWFVARVNNYLEEPQSSLLLGILIGAKKSLPQNLTDQLSTVGLSHIVAVSGFNISVIISALHFLSRLFGRKASFVFSLGLITCFVVLTGASASVIRAAVMGLMLLLAYELGRPYSVLPVLVFAASIMVWLNPKILFWDIGFQLSFAATLGIVVGMGIINVSFSDLPKFLGLKNIFFTTLFATVFTLPLVLFHFGRFGIYALPVNLLVLPIVPPLMLVGFLIVLPGLAPGFAIVASWLLSYILKASEMVSSLPFAKLEKGISGPALAAIYMLLVLVVGGFYYKLRQREKPVVETTML